MDYSIKDFWREKTEDRKSKKMNNSPNKLGRRITEFGYANILYNYFCLFCFD